MSVDPVRIRSLYETTLKPRLEGLESFRRTLRGYIIKAIISILGPFLLWYFGGGIAYLLGFSEAVSTAVTVVTFIGIFVGVIFAGMRFGLPGITAYANYKAKFKQDVVSEIFKMACPGAEYAPQHGIAKDVFIGCDVFQDRGSYSTDDRVRGRIGQTPFEAAEVKREYSTGSGKNSRTYTVFHGLFFHLDFNKSLSGVTFVQPEQAQSHQIGGRKGMTVATLENPDFEKEFKVWTTNEVEARYILTPAMMEKLLSLRQAAEHPVFLGFRGNRAFLGVHYGRSLFEPGIASTTSMASIEEMAEHFSLAEVVVNELDLNTRIWTKGVDDSLLHAPADPDTNPLDALADKAPGTLTEGDVWKAVTDAVGAQADDTGPPATRPAGTRIAIEHRPDGATVSYGFSIGFIICLLLSLGCAVAVISALRLLGEQGFFPPGISTAWLPAIPLVDEYVQLEPLAWLVPCALVGGFLSLYWIFRVHKVEITPSTVYIHRGLRPIARRYPRPPYDVILNLEKSVHVGKSGATSLINPTASPNLSKEEARWVAQEMRRAVKQTMQGRALMTLLAVSIAAAAGAVAQEPAVPVGHWQSVTSETYTSALHPILTGGEMYLKIDVSNDGSFRGEWGEYFCSGGSLGAYGYITFPCRLSGKGAPVSGRFGPGRQGVIDLGQRGRSAFNWTAPAAGELAIDLPKNWQGADAVLYRARMTRDGKSKSAAAAAPAPDAGPLLSAVALYREFKQDEKGALKRHAGRRLVLEGRRGTLIELSAGGAAIHIADGFTSRALVLVFGDLREVSGISEGAPFRFTCTVESFDYLYVHLEDCSIVR